MVGGAGRIPCCLRVLKVKENGKGLEGAVPAAADSGGGDPVDPGPRGIPRGALSVQ